MRAWQVDSLAFALWILSIHCGQWASSSSSLETSLMWVAMNHL